MRHLTYFKRHRMDLDLRPPRPPAALPPGFDWVPWNDHLLAAHAEAKFLSFQGETDAVLFPGLGHPAGCLELMRAIRCRPGFCPGATWLVVALGPGEDGTEPAGAVGTVQGVVDEHGHGGIQNLGVLADYRGRGVGRALLLRALAGFEAAGVRTGYLEVTARNAAAVRMYRAVGFRSTKTLYRAVEVPAPPAVAAFAVGL